MSQIIKQHLLCATRAELDDYFSDVRPVTESTDFHGEEFKFELPTWTIKQQLDDIEKKEEPKTGFIWYFIRRIKNNSDGTYIIDMGFRQEMVWIKNGSQFEPYIMKTINELLQHFENSNIMEKK